jgi:hypothetical protein
MILTVKLGLVISILLPMPLYAQTQINGTTIVQGGAQGPPGPPGPPGTGGGSPPAGSTGDVQINAGGGNFGNALGFNFTGTTLTVPNLTITGTCTGCPSGGGGGGVGTSNPNQLLMNTANAVTGTTGLTLAILSGSKWLLDGNAPSTTTPVSLRIDQVSASTVTSGMGSSFIQAVPFNTIYPIVLYNLVCIQNDGYAHTCTTSSTFFDGINQGTGIDRAGNYAANLAFAGESYCLFDNTAVVGNWVTESTTTAGNCHDTGSSGATPPTGVVLVGRTVVASGGPSIPPTIQISRVNTIPTSSGGSGSAIANISITTVAGSLGAAPACTTFTATPMTGLITTSAIIPPTPTSNTTSVAGWQPGGGLGFAYYVSAGTFNWAVCNNNISPITYGGPITWNVGAN